MGQFCTKCGAENRDEARFCHACGNALETPIGDQSVPTPQESKVETSEPILTEKEATFQDFFFSTKGRVGRKEYFFRWFMPYLSSLIVLTILSNVLQMQQVESGIVLFANFAILLLIAVFLVAQILIGIKRLHDINASGWWSLLWLVPLANFVLLLVLFFKVTSTEKSQRSRMKTGRYTQTLLRWTLFIFHLFVIVGLLPFVAISDYMAGEKAKIQEQSSNITSQQDILHNKVLPKIVTEEELFPAQAITASGNKIGFINLRGNWIIQPIYDRADRFRDGLACVKTGRKYGCIDKRGNWVIQPIYEKFGGFSEGLSWVSIGDKSGFIDKRGNWVIQPIYDSAGGFSEGLAWVSIGDKSGFIDKSGKIVIQSSAAGLLTPIFSDGLALVQIESKYGFIDKSGKLVIQPIYDIARNFSDGLAAVELSGKWGFIDKRGNWVIQPVYEQAYDFFEGFASVEIGRKSGFIDNRKSGFIDKSGELVIQPVYDTTRDFFEGLARVVIGGKWGFIDKKGILVIDPVYDGVSDFISGFAAVVQNKQFLGYINKQGELVIQPKPYQQ